MNHYIWQIENIIKKHCELRKPVVERPLDLLQITRDSFWISENIGNNSYGFKESDTTSETSKLFCPEIIYSDKFNIKLGTEPVFRDHELDKEFTGLNHYLISRSLQSNTPIFICDNHNLVLEAW